MKVSDPKEGVIIKQQMVCRHPERLGSECWDSPASTVHLRGTGEGHCM